jgi:hypothetical protein
MQQELSKQIYNNKQSWKNTVKQINRIKSAKATKHVMSDIAPLEAQYDKVTVKVFHNDLLEVIESVTKYGWKPLVVNMINESFPLDALRNGSSGPCFDILRRTDIESFPINSSEFLWNDEVILFKNQDEKTYREPFKYSMISMVPIKNPQLISERNNSVNIDRYASIEHAKLMNLKLHTIFCEAVKHNINCVILSDMDCTIWNNPISHIVDEINKCISMQLVEFVFLAICTKRNIKHDSVFQHFHKNIKREIRSIFTSHKCPQIPEAFAMQIPQIPTKIVMEPPFMSDFPATESVHVFAMPIPSSIEDIFTTFGAPQNLSQNTPPIIESVPNSDGEDDLL